MKKILNLKSLFLFSGILSLGVFMSGAAFAQQDASTIAQNMVFSVEWVPGLITGIAYALGLLFGVLGILKLKDHVENANQTPLREGIIRLLAGGALFALPIVYEAMWRTMDPNYNGGFNFWVWLTNLFGGPPAFNAGTFNAVLNNIVVSIQSVPGVLSGAAYLLGLILGVTGILKLREHVDSPQQVSLREPVIRFLVGGGLFALPVIFDAMETTISGGGIGQVSDDFQNWAAAFIGGGAGGPSSNTCDVVTGAAALGGTLGAAMCNISENTSLAPGFFGAASYLFGLVLGIWGLLKVKDHVLNPNQTSIWEAVSRFVAGGAFFALPVMLEAIMTTLEGGGIGALNAANFNVGGALGGGLDEKMVSFMGDIYGPAIFVTSWFGYIVGGLFIMIGISRLLKSAQEGPRGPGGVGTIMTFLVGGALISFLPMVRAVSESIFGIGGGIESNGALSYTTGMQASEVAHVNAVIAAVMQFMMVLGIISFLRGIFIIRAVAEGNSQASMMAAVTHIIGGALAVNLGSVINMAQNTMGLNPAVYGVNFTQ